MEGCGSKGYCVLPSNLCLPEAQILLQFHLLLNKPFYLLDLNKKSCLFSLDKGTEKNPVIMPEASSAKKLIQLQQNIYKYVVLNKNKYLLHQLTTPLTTTLTTTPLHHLLQQL